MPEYRSSCQSWHKKSALLDNKEHSAEKHVPNNSAAHHFRIVWPTHQLSLMLVSTSVTLRSANLCWQNGSRLCFPDLWEEGINAGLLNYSFNGNLLIIVVTIMQENQTMHI